MDTKKPFAFNVKIASKWFKKITSVSFKKEIVKHLWKIRVLNFQINNLYTQFWRTP